MMRKFERCGCPAGSGAGFGWVTAESPANWLQTRARSAALHTRLFAETVPPMAPPALRIHCTRPALMAPGLTKSYIHISRSVVSLWYPCKAEPMPPPRQDKRIQGREDATQRVRVEGYLIHVVFRII